MPGPPWEAPDRRECRGDGLRAALRSLGHATAGRALPRLDPGVPGLRALLAAGLIAATVTGVLAWRSRQVAEPIAPPLPAAAARDLSVGPEPGSGSQPTPDAGPSMGSASPPGGGTAGGAGATAYVAGAAGAAATSAARVVVYVTGKVRRPGVFVLASGARVADAIEAAGGLRAGASPGGVNLARRVVDGEQIVAGAPATAVAAAAGGTGTAGVAPVNLNTATAGQLDALPGVGGVIAQRIVDYRDAHGGFQSVDQLKNVPGIGEGKFAEMRDKVCV